MANFVDPRENDLARLRALRAEKPVTQMGQIRWAWPEIKAALDLGHSLTTVHERLQEVGIHIPYRRLSLYIGRLRREESAHPSIAVTAPADIPATAIEARTAVRLPVPSLSTRAPEKVTESQPGQTSGRDPLANLRKYANSRPGFQWDEAPPDKDKLF